MTCCLPALLALCRLDHGQRRQLRWRWQQWQRSGGSDGDNDSNGSNITLQLRLQSDEHRCGFRVTRVEVACGVNTAGNEPYFDAKVLCGFVLITRLRSHAICGSTHARSI